ncbi:hypothetical protein K1719_037452 [Acacia pycnantha]|nr:hypothetical protein K1719_037452 [Acacia pycnantha]
MENAEGDQHGSNNSSGSRFRRPSSSSRKLIKREIETPSKLPSDVLNIIAKKLDIDELFSFGEVCKDWRLFFHSDFWRNFMASHGPLIVQKTPHAKKSCSFFSISEERVYNTTLPFFSGFSLVGFSSGYTVMAGSENAIKLLNPFSRKKMAISGSTDQGCIIDVYDRATLAFAKNSQEFILVALCTWSSNMHVYQSRNSSWGIYSSWGNPWRIMDVTVFRKTLYAITDKADIGIVKLNTQTLKLLQMKNKPSFSVSNLKLVSADDGDDLLVVYVRPNLELQVYMVDLLVMAWFRIKSLGDRALFLGGNSKCYSLRSPSKWGFDSNCVYLIGRTSQVCKVVSMENNEVIKTISLPVDGSRLGGKLYNYDWCFRHRRDEVDYSLHE